MRKFTAAVAYMLVTFGVVGVAAPMLVSARSYEALAAGVALVLVWLFASAFMAARMFNKNGD